MQNIENKVFGRRSLAVSRWCWQNHAVRSLVRAGSSYPKSSIANDAGGTRQASSHELLFIDRQLGRLWESRGLDSSGRTGCQTYFTGPDADMSYFQQLTRSERFWNDAARE